MYLHHKPNNINSTPLRGHVGVASVKKGLLFKLFTPDVGALLVSLGLELGGMRGVWIGGYGV
jgi:hypothetical protein